MKLNEEEMYIATFCYLPYQGWALMLSQSFGGYF